MPETVVIQPRRSGFLSYLSDAWRERHLLSYFARDAVKSFHKETIIGWPWLFIRPLLPALMFAFLFRGIEKLQSASLPYVLYVLSGMVLIQISFFGLRRIIRSVAGNAAIVGKKYFPRIILPTAHLAVLLLQLGAGLLLLVIVTLIVMWSGKSVTISTPFQMTWALVAIVIVLGFTFSIGATLALFNTAARDVRMSVSLINAGLMFLSPVFYPITLIEEPTRSLILALNPLAVAVALFRYGLYSVPLDFAWYFVPVAIVSCVVYCLIAVILFFRADPILADLV